MASRWCAFPAEAEDAAQEVLLRFIRQSERPRDEIAWLYVVTRRVCNRMRLRAATRADAEQFYSASPREGMSNELLLDVARVLRRLPPRDRSLLQMVMHGLPAREIADVLGCKTRDVGQLVTRARRKARRLRGG